MALPASAQSPEVLREAQRMMAEGDCSGAIARLEALSAEALSSRGAALLGRCYQAQLQHARAVAAFARADTSLASVRADLGESLERLGREDEAERHYRAAYRKAPTNRAYAASLARLLANQDNYDEVAAIYERLVEADPQNSYLHAQLGTAYARLDSIDRAIPEYELAFALDPRNVRTVLALTKVYYDIEYYVSARRAIDKALDEQPRHPALWRRSGEVALKEEDYKHAATAFRYVLQYGDTTATDLRNLGVSQYLLSDYPRALPTLDAAFQGDSTDVLTAFYLGLTHQQLQRYDDALAYLDHAATLLSQGMLADVHARIGGTYDQMDRHADAIDAYRLSRRLDPRRPEILFHLAALYDEYYADKNVAAQQYERFLNAVPEGTLPQMESYAEQRLKELRERAFFRQGRPPEPTSLDTLVIEPPDSTKGRQE